MTPTNTLKNYENIVDFLGLVFGENCEVVLQDVKEGHVVAIANGHVSGRSVGAPLTDYALKIVQSEIWKQKDFDYNYVGKTSDNHELRSSTLFIKDKQSNELLAMLCINIDKQPYIDAVDILSKLGMLSSDTLTNTNQINSNIESNEANNTNLIENFSHNVSHIVASLLPEVLGLPSDIPLSRLTQDEKMKIIEKLSARGVFKIKGSIQEVAKVFDCSEATVYRYLSKID